MTPTTLLQPPPELVPELKRLRLMAALTDPDSIRTYLTGVGLPADPPPIAPPWPPPQAALDFPS